MTKKYILGKSSLTTIATLCVLATLATLAACGGGGGSSAPATNSPAQGLWSGTTATNSAITIIVLGDGSYYGIHSPDNAPASIDGYVQGTGTATASPGTFSSSDFKDFTFASTTPTSATLTASYVAKQSFNGTVSVAGGGTATFTTNYNSNYATVPTLSAIAGNYTGTAVLISSGTNGASTITISSTGSLSDDSANCKLAGSVSPRSEGNAYNFSATFPSTCPNAALTSKTFTGLAYFNAATKEIYVMTSNAARTDGVFYYGAKP